MIAPLFGPAPVRARVAAMNNELGNLTQPIVIEWSIEELDRWVRAQHLNNKRQIGLWRPGATGFIQITQEWAGGIQGALIGFDGEALEGGQIRLTPYLNEVAQASPAAVAELRYLCSALEATGRLVGEYNGRRHYPPLMVSWNRGELFEWLKWRYVTTYAIELWRSLSSEGELFIYGLCPYSPCAMNVYLKVEDMPSSGTRIMPRVTVRNDKNRQQADAEINNLRSQLEAAGGMMPKSSNLDSESKLLVPTQPARRQKWVKTWQVIKPEVLQNHLTGYEIAASIKDNQLLQDKLRDCPQGGDTLQKIVNAGLAGKLEI